MMNVFQEENEKNLGIGQEKPRIRSPAMKSLEKPSHSVVEVFTTHIVSQRLRSELELFKVLKPHRDMRYGLDGKSFVIMMSISRIVEVSAEQKIAFAASELYAQKLRTCPVRDNYLTENSGPAVVKSDSEISPRERKTPLQESTSSHADILITRRY